VYRTSSATPAIAGSWSIAAGASYGWDPDVLVEGDSRHRAGARLALGYSPWSFLTFSVAVDGAVDAYQWAGAAAESLVVGVFGDPRLGIRTGFDLGHGLALGGVFDLWIPSGRGAFQVVGDSLSPSILATFSFTPERFPLGLHLDFGYRHNRSLQMLGDVGQLTAEQLLLSGAVSSQHHLAVDLAVEYRLGPVAPYVELSVDVPVGGEAGDAPALLVGFGARAWLGPGDVAQLYLGMDFRAAGADATLDPAMATIVTAPPLLNVQFGVVFRLPVPREVAREAEPTAAGDEPAEAAAADEPRPLGRIGGVVQCGGEPCGPTTRVAVARTGASPIAPDDATGRFASAELPAGSYEVEVTAEGREGRRLTVEVAPGAAADVSIDLPPASGSAAGARVQGQVTNFQAAPVRATVLVPGLGVEIQTDEDGRFEIEAAPGRYEVVVSAEGYRTQHSRVQVRADETVVMNVELRGR
jgi:hypothetical protein